MPVPYSFDLRSRIIETLKENQSKQRASKLFKVSIRTVERYWKQYQETGKIEIKKPTSTRPRKVDYDKVKEYVDKNNDQTLKEIGDFFKISAFAILKILRTYDYTFKKKRSYIGNVTK